MKLTFNYSFITLLLSLNMMLINILGVYGQNNNDFTRISISEGLSQSTVRAILQDSEGYMWFGTQDGLNKYDGYNFTIYKNDLDNPNTLSNNEITSIVEDNKGNLWIGTNGGGLNKFNKTTETFTHFKTTSTQLNKISNDFIFSLYIDSKEGLWIGTVGGGLNVMDLETERIEVFNTNLSEMNRLEVLAICEDKEGSIWVGTNKGLNKINQETNQVVNYKFQPNKSELLQNDYIRALFNDSSGELWVGSYGGGLSKYDYENDTFIQYQLSKKANKTQVYSEFITSITEDKNGNLWFGTWGDGVRKFNKKTKEFTNYTNNQDNLKSLSYNTIWSVYVDKSNLLWVGTFGAGLNKIPLEENKFGLYKRKVNNPNSISSNSVRGIYEDEKGILWVGGYGGLNKIDRESGNVKRYDNNDFWIGPTYAIYPDEDDINILWIGTEGKGMYKFNKETEVFKRVFSEDIKVTHIFSIQDDKEGNLWLGAQSGFYKFNKATEEYSQILRDYSAKVILANRYSVCVFIDSKETIWVGTNGKGLIKYDKDKNSFKEYEHKTDNPNSISNNSIKSIFEDNDGVLWIGTNGGGLNKFNEEDEKFIHYTEKDGLPNNVVYAILEDKEQHLWLSTNKGISKFNKTNISFKNFTADDGLQSNEFNTGSYFKSKSGEMFFGGVKGLNTFFPNQIKDNQFIPPIVVTSFKKFDKEINYKNIMSEKDIINLTHKDNYISFEFAALDYYSPEHNKYAYKLEGLDTDWIYSDTRRFTSYTNLDGGNYFFKVKGTNNDGLWNETGVTIPIYVKPPFRKTAWFIFLCGLSLLTIVYGVFKIRLNQVRLKTKNKYLKKQNEEKIALLKEVHHRMKNNLQMVNSLLKFQSREIEDKKIISMFKDAQNRVLSMSLLHEKMYNSKDLQHINIEEHLSLLINDLVKSYAIGKKINLNIKIENVDFEIQTLVPLGLIINEMITNSLKYAFKDRNKGTISVHLKPLDTKLYELIIGDDGEGYSPEKKSEGLGTKLIQIFAKQLNGAITKLEQSGTFYKLVFEKIDIL